MGVTDYQTAGAPPAQGAPVQGVPVQAVPVAQPQMQTVVVQVAEDPAGPKDHYWMGCLASGLCGCFGLIGQKLCCPTLAGNYGGCTGCSFNMFASILMSIAMLVLEQTLSYTEFTTSELTPSDCDKYDGSYNLPDGCYLSSCPSGWAEEGTKTSANGVEQCTARHLLLILRLVQIAFGSIILAIALSYCIRYRREWRALQQTRTGQHLLGAAQYPPQQVQVQQPQATPAVY